MKVILCEKPSVAQDIAKALGKAQKKDGYIQAGEYAITWAFGHLFEIDDEVAPKKWSLDTLPIFPEKFKYRLTKGAGKQFKVIKELLKKADGVVIATDAGREGELIARLILYQAGWKSWDRTYRLWTSEALTPDVVERELKNLKPAKDFDSLYWSALGRQHADWIVGINLTRLVSVKAGKGQVWSVGRVQTPTLKLIVEREKEIREFKPEEYYVVKAKFDKEGSSYEGTLLTQKAILDKGGQPEGAVSDDEGDEKRDEDRGFRLSKEEAERIVQEVRSEGKGIVVEVKRQKKREKPPLLHSLTSLQREANKLYGFSAQKTLDIAQKLYETHKCLSYPRTDAQHLAESSRDLVKQVLNRLGKKELLPAVEKTGKRVFDDSKLTDHHALIPLAPLPANAKEDEKKIYNLVLRKFLGAFMPDYEYEVTTVITKVGNHSFLSKGKTDINLGWKALYQKDEKESKLPRLEKGDGVVVKSVSSQQKFTQPPPRYSEATILKKMEKLNLGTPATRSSILESLKSRGYVLVEKKSLVPSEKALELIDKMRESPIASPEMTGEWERELDSIYTKKRGKKGYEDFLANIRGLTQKEIERLKDKEFTAKAMATAKMLKFAKELERKTGMKLEGRSFDDVKEFIEKAKEHLSKKMEEGIGANCSCGGNIKAFPKGWKCENCESIVWDSFMGVSLKEDDAVALLQGKKVVLKGLRSKAGKRFNAEVSLDDRKKGRLKIEGFVQGGKQKVGNNYSQTQNRKSIYKRRRAG